MNKDTAKRLVQETLQNSFDKERFTFFSKNLLNHIKETPQTIYRGNFIPDAYKPYIKTLDRIGKYEDPEKHKIDILIVRLRKQISLERARTMQRNFVAWYLNGSRGGVLKDATLAAFVAPDEEDWRFSFIKMEYKLAETLKGNIKAKEQLTPARRYSFLVGKNETSHTAQSQFVPILVEDDHNPTLKQIEDAFGIEKVTKEFFGKYRELFLKLKESLEKIVKKDKKIKSDFEAKNVDTVDFAKKLLGQIVFLYFLQKKGWFGVARDADWGTGPKNFLRQLFDKETAKGKNFFNDSLELLFYEALAVERTDDFYGKFNCKIPFLNGGLFDPINNYDWVHTDILLPNELFSNTEKTKQGDTGTGILDVFDRYNFTVKEDEPLEKEVAVDPEMLGKVFENLLEVKDRKSKGTYYTPREIVHYMCQQSLINYLDTAVNTGKKKTIVPEKPKQNKFFGKPEHQQMSLHSGELIVPREDITSLILHGQSALEHDTRVEIKGRETKRYPFQMPETIRKNAAAIDKALESIRICDPAAGSGAFLVGMMHEIVNARQVLSTYLNGSKNRTPYGFKRDAIQNCLYGVDIDPGAVEIAKLRLWLSLVVDEEEREKIKPLPNLDYKIVCGNSLIGVPRTLENWKDFAELERLKPLFFDEANARKKQDYKNQIDQTIAKITNGHTEFDFEIYFSEVFHEKGGFDVAIANPPYITVALGKKQKFYSKDEVDALKNKYSDIFEYKGNTYILFIKQSASILATNRFCTFIIPNTLLLNATCTKVRKFLLFNSLICNLVNIKDRVFESGEIGGNLILIFRKTGQQNKHKIKILEIDELDKLNLQPEYVEVPQEMYAATEGYRFYLDIGSSQLMNKIRRQTVSLGQCADFYNGIKTGDNKKFIANNKVDARYREIIRGRDVQRYKIAFSGKYVLFDKQLLWSNTNEEKLTKAPKIVVRQTGDSLIGALDNRGYLTMDTTHLIFDTKVNIRFLLALLNSRLMNWFHQAMTEEQGKTFAEIKIVNLKKLPIRKIPTQEQQPFINIVDKILAVTKEDDYLDDPVKQTKVEKLEKQIDQMVYKLYGLTKEEIAVVEGSDNKKQNNKG